MGKNNITFLGSGTTYEGKLEFEGTVRIDGFFQGEIVSSGTLVVGKEAGIEGAVTVGELIISGNMKGEISAKKRMVLQKAASVKGKVSTPVLVIEEGGLIEGEVEMPRGKDAESTLTKKMKKVGKIKTGNKDAPEKTMEKEIT